LHRDKAVFPRHRDSSSGISSSQATTSSGISQLPFVKLKVFLIRCDHAHSIQSVRGGHLGFSSHDHSIDPVSLTLDAGLHDSTEHYAPIYQSSHVSPQSRHFSCRTIVCWSHRGLPSSNTRSKCILLLLHFGQNLTDTATFTTYMSRWLHIYMYLKPQTTTKGFYVGRTP